MATYKVIQDIEAEDKLIWLFSFRQFVYLLIALLGGYISYLFFVIHAWFLDIFILPFVIFFGVLAYPLGKDQPTEVWVLAKVRFFFKPRKRIWTQDGTKELVTITVPKKIEKIKTNGLEQEEVKSRLKALASTLDSRGWAIKNVTDIPFSQLSGDASENERLLSPVSKTSSDEDFSTPENDLFNEEQNPVSQKMEDLIVNKEDRHHQEILKRMDNIRKQNSEKKAALFNKELIKENPVVKPDNLAIQKIKDNQRKSFIPTTENTATQKNKNPDIINLSRSDGLSISVLSHEADKLESKDQQEISFNLH